MHSRPSHTVRKLMMGVVTVGSALAMTVVSSSAFAAPPRALAPDHPLLGTWTFKASGDGCVETWSIRPDGSALVTGGEEVVETQMDVADRPDARGAYRWVDQVVKSNGKGDCSGQSTAVGLQWTSYIRFDSTLQKMAVCEDAALRECIGPYLREKPTDRRTNL